MRGAFEFAAESRRKMSLHDLQDLLSGGHEKLSEAAPAQARRMAGCTCATKWKHGAQ